MQNPKKYQAQYTLPPENCYDWMTNDRLKTAPTWCSVDLRDGNQSLITPMSLEEKLAFYHFLLKLGFKEIEVGFPAASQTEYAFLRTLIEEDLIPEDVTIQVLTQSRPHIIQETFAAIRGARRVIVHLYNSTSVAQRQQVFGKTKEEIIQIAVEGATLFNEFAAQMPETECIFQYSPESFTGTEPEFAIDICNAVIDVWRPTARRPVIINLPATVEVSMPHVYAAQISYMGKKLAQRENIILSLHPHNDRGTGVAAAELGLLAGADRVEGTLFGNGERTGNVDIITLALNLLTHGVDPGLNLQNMPEIVKTYEVATAFRVPPRHPYAGELVFAAFSGSHQDAIAKGMAYRETQKEDLWTVPYLPIDPHDLGRQYDADVIRINSQSGKGGVSYILEQNFGYQLPKDFKGEVGSVIKDASDKAHKELSPSEIHALFIEQYVNLQKDLGITQADWQRMGQETHASATFSIGEETITVNASGNGSLDSIRACIGELLPKLKFRFEDYAQHALEDESSARAAAYVKILDPSGQAIWGVGVHHDITMASVYALVSAVNRLIYIKEEDTKCQ